MRRRTVHRLNSWVKRLAAPSSHGSIICFPPAGGGASMFYLWLGFLPEDIELYLVQPPGREERQAEPPWWTATTAVDAVAAALAADGGRPSVVFGHSLGALVAALLVAKHGAALGGPHLVVSSAAPPPSWAAAGVAEEFDIRTVQSAIERVSGLSGSQLASLSEQLRTPLERRWQADLSVQQTIQAPPARLPVAVTVWGAESDEVSADELRAWERLAPGHDFRLWPGRHDYPFASAHVVVPALAELVRSSATPSSTGCASGRPGAPRRGISVMTDTSTSRNERRTRLRTAIVDHLARSWRGGSGNRTGEGGDLPPFGDDDNLFDLGLVDSLTLAELLVMVERLSGREIDFLTVEPEVFFTLRGMLDFADGTRKHAER